MSGQGLGPERTEPDRHCELLNSAIDDLLDGRDASLVGARLPAALQGLLPLAARLARSRRTDATGPRPTFVLALEEQVRADFRLARAAAPPRRWLAWLAVVVLAVAVLSTALVGLRPGRSGSWPGIGRAWEEARVAFAPAGAERGMLLLDLAWARLQALAEPDAGGQAASWPAGPGPVDATVSGYRRAVSELATDPDARFAARVVADLQAARRVMTDLAARAAGSGRPQARWFDAAVADLGDLLVVTARLAPGLVATAPDALPRRTGPTEGAPTATPAEAAQPNATAAASEPAATPTGPAAPAAPAPATATSGAANTLVAATAAPTLGPAPVGPTVAPTDAPPPTSWAPTAVPEAPERPRPHTPTEPPTAGTAATPDTAVTPTAGARATATLDAWPVTSTPLPTRDLTAVPPVPPGPPSATPPDAR